MVKRTGKVQKFEIAAWLNAGTASAEDYVRIKKSTELTLEFDPQTEDYDYIADESGTTDLESYKPAISGLPLTMYRDDPDFKALWDYAYNLKTGGDSITDLVMVYKFDEDAVATGTYKAWKADVSVIIQNINAVDGTLEFDLPFRGTVKKGTVTEVEGKPVFTEAE